MSVTSKIRIYQLVEPVKTSACLLRFCYSS